MDDSIWQLGLVTLDIPYTKPAQQTADNGKIITVALMTLIIIGFIFSNI